MKYRHKIFTATMILFLTALNFAVFFLADSFYNTSLNTERERGFSEHRFISKSLNEDITAVKSRESAGDTAIKSLFQRYADFYFLQGMRISLKDANGGAYSNLPIFGQLPETTNKDALVSVVLAVDETPYLLVTGIVGETGYTLVTARSIALMQERSNTLTWTLILLCASVSLVLSAALMLILKRLTRPINKLSIAARALACGEYQTRTIIPGNDELSLLSGSFNAMADEIQNQMQELSQAAERKQLFIDGLAHEMRTPLTAINGYAQYIGNAYITDEDRHFAVSYIEKESRRLSELSDKLFLLTKLRGDQPEYAPVDMPSLLNGVKQTLGVSAPPGVNIHVRGDGSVWQSDEQLLYMLFINLAENAIRACGDKGNVWLKVYKTHAIVRDDGRGIDEEALLHITEPFYRADKSRSRKMGGAGLGLSICTQISEALELKLEFYSKPNKGTSVLVGAGTAR